MPTYMLGPGGLEPVVHQDDVPDGFGEEWCALVRPQVLELTDTPPSLSHGTLTTRPC